MTGLPKTAGSELLEELNGLSRAQAKDDFLLRRLEVRARQLIKVDAGTAYECLGAIAAMRGDVEGMRSNHENAIRLLPASASTYANYAVSLERTGFLDEASDQAGRAYERDKGNPKYVKCYVMRLFLSGMIDSACDLLDTLEKMVPGSKYEFAESIRQSARLIRERGIGQQHTAALVGLALRALHEQGVFYVERNVRLIADDEAEFCVFELAIEGDLAKICLMTDRLAELAVDSNIDPTTWTVFCVRFGLVPTINVNHTIPMA